MNLHLSYVPLSSESQISDRKFQIAGQIWNVEFEIRNYFLLDLFYLDLCISLTVTLRTLVLFAALLLKDDDLFAFAVANDGRLYRGVAADLGIASAAQNEGRDVDLASGFAFDGRHPQYLSVFDWELLSACFYNCVTHFLLSPTIGRKTPDSRKVQIILKNWSLVNCRQSHFSAGACEAFGLTPYAKIRAFRIHPQEVL